MANELKFKVVVSDDGSMKIVKDKTKAVKKELEGLKNQTDRTGKSRETYNKGEKALYQTNLASSKGFSKMKSAMGDGSSGLVAAYATLAANVFALTAAFSALQGAAQVQQLVDSVAFLGRETGRNLTIITDKLKEVTSGAISTEQALRSTALATSAGFSTDQIEGLAKVARGASIALGRDMGDAFDRLIRGSAKLEPEILDELGIIVRLEDSYEQYARGLNKTAEELTSFEKKQAFTNAVLVAGTDQFGRLADELGVNPYDKLAASLKNLAEGLLSTLNKGLGPTVDFFANNMTALKGLVALFASTIASSLLPMLGNASAGYTKLAKEGAAAAISQISLLEGVDSSSKSFNTFATGLKDGTKSLDDLDEGFATIDKSIAGHRGTITRLGSTNNKLNTTLEIQQGKIFALQTQKQALIAIQKQGLLVTSAESASNAIAAGSNLSLGLAYKFARDSILEFAAAQGAANGTMFAGLGIAARLKVALFGVGLAAKTAGAMILASLGWISIIVTFVIMFYDQLKEYFFPPDLIQERIDKLTANIEKAGEVHKQYGNIIEGTDEQMKAGFKMSAGLVQQQIEFMEKLAKVSRDAAQAAKDASISENDSSKEEIKNIEKQISFRKRKIAQNKKLGLGDSKALFQKTSVNDNYAAEIKELESKMEGLEHQHQQTAGYILKTHSAAITAVSQTQLTGLQASINALSEGAMSEPLTPYINQLKDLQAKAEAGTLTSKEFAKELALIGRGAQETESFLNDLPSLIEKIGDEQRDLSKSASTPYDGMIDSLVALDRQYDSLKENSADTFADLIKNAKVLGKITDENGALGDPRALKEMIELYKTSRKTLADFPGLLKKNKTALKAVGKIEKNSAEALKEKHKLQKETITLTQNAITAQILLDNSMKSISVEERAILKSKTDQRQAELDILKSQTSKLLQQNELDQQAAGFAKQQLDINSKNLELKKKSLNLDKEMLTNRIRLANLNDPNKKVEDLSAQQEYQLFLVMKQQSEAMLIAERDMKKLILENEFIMIGLKLDAIEAELQSSGQLTKDAKDRLATLREGIAAQKALSEGLIEKEMASSQLAMQVEEKRLSRGAEGAAVSAAGTGGTMLERAQNFSEAMKPDQDLITQLTEQTATLNAAAKAARAAADNARDAGTSDSDALAGDALAAESAAASSQTNLDAANKGPELDAGEKIAAMQSMMNPMVENLKSMGPEGELVGAAVEGTMSIMAAFEGIGEASEKSGGKAAATAAAIGTAIGAINGMMQASAKQRTSEIDKQIAAEKKRDGKSAESIAKIKAMEKKKEAIKRKAFEQNKKMQMAQTIMNTASAIMTFMAQGNIGMAIASGIMGALQLGVISQQQYQGPSQSSAPSEPTALKVGKRKNSVDLARSTGGGGDLGYMRGESGTGNTATNFRAAFTGAKYRAEGGNTGFIVGEQGPELFVPETPGEIVDAGATDGMSQQQSVVFHINTIDASGVEDLLVSQRGNIIGMLRDAANTTGEPFMESVDTSQYTPSAGGARSY